MANFYYVKSGGSATGDAGRVATTRSTGSFATKGASAYYDNIVAALAATTPPADGDFIMCSDSHAKVYTTNTTCTFVNELHIISVADANCDQYAIGASETVFNSTTGLDLTLTAGANKRIIFSGVTLGTEDTLTYFGVGVRWTFNDTTFEPTITNTLSDISTHGAADGAVLEWNNVSLNFKHITSLLNISNGAHLIANNLTGDFTRPTFINVGGVGGMRFTCRNSDLATVISASGQICEFAAADDMLDVTLERCKLPTGFTVFGTQPTTARNFTVHITECDQTDGYHYFYHETWEGKVEEDTTTYLNATYDGSTGFSAKATSSAHATISTPVRQKLGVIPAQDLTTAMTVTVECSSDASLTDNDIWIEIERQDTTDQALGVQVDTKSTADVLAAGTALTTAGTGAWTSGDTEDYIITKDLGAIANATNSNVMVYLCVGKPSIDVFFDLPTIAAT